MDIRIATVVGLLLVLAAADSILESDLQNLPEIATYRRINAQRNIQIVETHNRDPTASFKMRAYPQFIGLSDQEFAAAYLNNVQSWGPAGSPTHRVILPSEAVKTKNGIGKVSYQYFDVDLSVGVMRTPVHNQGICGNCYAVSVIDGIDMTAKGWSKGWPLLSDQQLTDCSKNYYSINAGCGGGNIYYANEYVRIWGVHAASAYPAYSQNTGYSRPCPTFPSSLSVFKIAYWVQTTFGNCYELAVTLQNRRPIVVAMTGGSLVFKMYSSGILPDCGTYYTLDHAVLLVGVSLNTNKGNYWLVKNSWGTNWGEQGYVRISNQGTSCLLCYYGVYSVV